MNMLATHGARIGAALVDVALPIAAIIALLSATWLAIAVRRRVIVCHRLAVQMLLSQIVSEAVVAVAQRVCYLLGRSYDPRYPGGRGLTMAEGVKLKRVALGHVKNVYGHRGLDELARTLGLCRGTHAATTAALDDWLDTLIEAEVLRSKQHQ